jgi:hypothetical protein
MPPAT